MHDGKADRIGSGEALMAMRQRLLVVLVFLAPLAALAGLYLLGRTVPVPLLGRDYVIRIPFDEKERSLDLPRIEGPGDPSRPLVVIDAGHGGHDPGTIGSRYREKTVVLGLAKALRDELLREGGVRVAMTRDDDSFVTLGERAEIARALGADLFLSIHADSAGEKGDVAGASIYTLGEEASSEAAARFAERENSADRVNGVDVASQEKQVSDILVELAQRQTSGASSEFSDLVVREGKGTLTFHPQAQRRATLEVLRAPDMPSVLYESGFMSNRQEEEALASPEGQQRFAEAMARAIRVYFARQSGA